MKTKSFTLLWLVPLAFAVQAFGQPFSIDWYKVAGGGGASTGGVYSLSGTVGQQDAGGPLTGGNFSLTGGFWALPSAVQTPGAPTLYITRAPNSVTVYWQAVAGWSLQQNNNLSPGGTWSTSTGVISANGTNSLTLAPPLGNWFFRLRNTGS